MGAGAYDALSLEALRGALGDRFSDAGVLDGLRERADALAADEKMPFNTALRLLSRKGRPPHGSSHVGAPSPDLDL